MRRSIEQVLAGAAAIGAGWAFRRSFEPGDLVVPVVASATAAVIVGCAIRRGATRWHVAIELAGSAAALAIFLSVFVVGGADLGVLVDGVVNGWAKILSSTLPVAPRPELAVVPAVLTWVAAAFASSAADRTRSSTLPLLPMPVVFGLALALGVRGRGTTTEVAAPLLLAGGLFLAVRARPRATAGPEGEGRADAALRRRRTVVGLAAAAVVVAIAASFGSRAPLANARPPVDPREHRDDPVETRVASNPLATLRSQLLTDPPTTLFRVEADRPAIWRLTVLDAYDGREWRSTATYRVAGRVLPPVEAGTSRTQLHQKIELDELESPWLPAADRPRSVTGIAFRFDPESGVLLRQGSRADDRYEVISDIPDFPESSALGPAAPSSAPELAVYRENPPGLPLEIIEAAESAIGTGGTPSSRLVLFEKHLKERFVHDPEETSGHSYGRLRTFVQERRGSAEQFPALFALVARHLGLPARVVVGYGPGDDTTGVFVVSTADARAWVDVAFEGIGWVRFDPTPTALGQEPPKAEEEVKKQERQQKEGVTTAVGTGVKGDPGGSRADGEGGTYSPWLIAAAVATVIPVVVIAASVAVRRRRRSRRRTAPSERLRVIGAWDEAVDVVTRFGAPTDEAMTATEIERAGRDRLGGEVGSSLEPLRHMANLAHYGTLVEGQGLDGDAWEHVVALRKAAANAVKPGRRVAAMVDPRPLARR